MMDGIIKADGTSRLMRATLPATYEEFKAQAAAGTLPLDILFNEAGWSQLPTFLNKANLLKDLTANLFGLGADAVPDDVLRVLSRFYNGLGNEYVWAKTQVTYTKEYLFTSATESPYQVGDLNASATVYYADGVDLDMNLINPVLVTIVKGGNTNVGVLRGKFWRIQYSSGLSQYIYYSSANATIGSNGNYLNGKTLSSVVNTPSSTLIGYVNSPDPNAYPVDDGYTYTALGQLGNNVQIATGSYTGTGTYGSSNKNSLTFDFVPKFVYIKSPDYIDTILLWVYGDDYSPALWGDASYYHRVTLNGNTFSWYSTKSEYYQCNSSGVKYNYVAIG